MIKGSLFLTFVFHIHPHFLLCFCLLVPRFVPYQFLQTIICHFNTLRHARLGLIFLMLLLFQLFLSQQLSTCSPTSNSAPTH